VLEQGVSALPDSWRLRQDLGFFHFLFLGDAHTASRILVEASRIPGAAFWLRTMAADLLLKGGDRDSSRRMWRQMFEQAEEGIIRENARVRLQILDSLDVRDALAAAVAEYERRHLGNRRRRGGRAVRGVDPPRRARLLAAVDGAPGRGGLFERRLVRRAQKRGISMEAYELGGAQTGARRLAERLRGRLALTLGAALPRF